uniref:Uncharacterized protein n=1 Tax=Myripristis murdjan TaxID=586833 RepID=A0A667WL27_9TELE
MLSLLVHLKYKAEMVLTVLSPFLGAEAFLGKRMSLERYSFKRCTLACRDSVDLLRRRGSTEMPMVRYLTVGHLTCGLKGPATGRGAIRRALA